MDVCTRNMIGLERILTRLSSHTRVVIHENQRQMALLIH